LLLLPPQQQTVSLSLHLHHPIVDLATTMFPASVASRLGSKMAVFRNGRPLSLRFMGTITQGVEFDTIAREWRCKWSKDDDMKSLQQAQQVLDGILTDLKNTTGFKSVHRVVCGGHLDFKASHNHKTDSKESTVP
jgi:hypothetical protein